MIVTSVTAQQSVVVLESNNNDKRQYSINKFYTVLVVLVDMYSSHWMILCNMQEKQEEAVRTLQASDATTHREDTPLKT